MINSIEISTLSLAYINTVDNINRLNSNIRDIQNNVKNINQTIDDLLLRYNIKNMYELLNLINRIDYLKNIYDLNKNV